jgi:hypothetical protein
LQKTKPLNAKIMKKLFSLLAVSYSVISISQMQYDLRMTLNTPASGASATGTAAFSIAYTITNLGPGEIPQGDTLVVAVIHSNNNFSLNGTPGSVTLIPLPAALASGASISSALVGANANINLAAVNGEVCMFATVGLASATSPTGDPNDADMTNNIDCFISVPASAEIAQNTKKSALAFPNPVLDMLNVTVEGEDVVTISVIGLDGKVVFTTNGSVAVVAELNAGVYFYEATTASGEVIRNQFVKH